jgi:hypothetical protein
MNEAILALMGLLHQINKHLNCIGILLFNLKQIFMEYGAIKLFRKVGKHLLLNKAQYLMRLEFPSIPAMRTVDLTSVLLFSGLHKRDLNSNYQYETALT